MAKQHKLYKTREYKTWESMKHRCYQKGNASYKNYGAKGIIVCDRWVHSPEVFVKDMGKQPDGTTLDRIDSNGIYEPDNCRWATHTEQARNSSVSKLTVERVRWIKRLLAEGKLNQYQLASIFKVSQPTISAIVNNLRWADVKAWDF